MAGTIYEDFVHKIIGKDIGEKTASNILKLIVIIIGIVSTILVFVIENLGGLLPLAISLQGVTNGPLLGMFTIGVLFPRANAKVSFYSKILWFSKKVYLLKGAFYGAVGGLILVSGIFFPAKYYQSQGFLRYTPKPLFTNGCEIMNTTLEYTIRNNVQHIIGR